MPACYEGSMAHVYSCSYNWPVVLWNTSQNVLIWAKNSSISILWIVEVRERESFYIVVFLFTKWNYWFIVARSCLACVPLRHKHRQITCFSLFTRAKERNLKTVLFQFVNCFILLNPLQNRSSVVFREEDVAIVCFVCSAAWFVLKAVRLPVWVLVSPALAIRIEAK